MTIANWKRKEDSRRDRLYLVAVFEGGDADLSERLELELDTPFSFDLDPVDIVNDIAKLKILQDILDVNSKNYISGADHEKVKELYGQDVWELFYDWVPVDPFSDGKNCRLDRFFLIGYDADSNMYECESPV
jgi:hypothetical protein